MSMGILKDVIDMATKEFVEDGDRKILFDMWKYEQHTLANKAADYGKPDDRILKFIFDAWTACGMRDAEVIRKFFRTGYCYYFALMLQDAFPGGKLVWAKPYGHICYLYNDVPYEIEGVYPGDGTLVPMEELGDTFEAYRHRGMDDDLRHEMEDYAEEKDIGFEELCEEIYKLVPEDKRVKGHPVGTAMKCFRKYKDKV